MFHPAHIGVFEKRFAAIIQRVSIFEYFRYDTDGQTLLIEKLNLKESFFFSNRFKSSGDGVTLLSFDSFLFFDCGAVDWCCN